MKRILLTLALVATVDTAAAQTIQWVMYDPGVHTPINAGAAPPPGGQQKPDTLRGKQALGGTEDKHDTAPVWAPTPRSGRSGATMSRVRRRSTSPALRRRA